MWSVGYNGFGWSSTEVGAYAYRLYFYNGGVYPQDLSQHAYGFPLRCLQE